MVKAVKSSEVNKGKLWAILSYIFILWFVPLWVIKPRNKYSVYHAKQAFMLFLTYVAVWLVLTVLGAILTSIAYGAAMGAVAMGSVGAGLGVIGLLIGLIGLISLVVYVVLFVLWIIGIYRSATGQMTPLPIIGKLAEKWFTNL